MNFIFDPSLVLYLPLYELDGASIRDKSAYGHLATVTGALWRPNGRYFDNIDDKITIPKVASLDLNGSFTIEAWIQTTASGDNDGIVTDRNASNVFNYYFLKSDTNKGWFAIADGATNSSITGNTSINDGQFHHLVALRDVAADQIRLYVDASLDAIPVTDATIGSLLSPKDVEIGQDSSLSRVWNGTISEVRMYSRALTPLEIQHNYLATKGRYQ